MRTEINESVEKRTILKIGRRRGGGGGGGEGEGEERAERRKWTELIERVISLLKRASTLRRKVFSANGNGE